MMSDYDLRSLNLPKLCGKLLSIFTKAATNPITQPLLMGSLLENGGIPKLRKAQYDEEPTFLPLSTPATHALGHMDLPHQVPTNDRTDRDQLPFTLVRDYAGAYRQGRLTPLQTAEQVMVAIAESNKTSPPLHAISASLAEDVLKQAEHSTELLASGKPRSLLEGVPVAVKEEFDLVPYPTTVGTTFMGAQPARQDAYVAARLRAAGALLVGKTNMHEIGIAPNGENIHYGRIANPYDLQCDPGGSSSGSGAAVAAGVVPVAIGADGGGSIRIPASLCGVVGLKPTFGRVSEAGAAPLCWSVAHAGPLGASVEDVALTYQVIAGPDPNMLLTHQQPPVILDGWNTPDLKGVRLGIYPEWFQHASREVVECNEKMVAEFEKAGAVLVEVTIPELDAMRVAHAVIILSEMVAGMKNFASFWGEFAPSTRLSLVIGEVMSAQDYLQAQRVRTRAMRIFAQVYQDVDVLLTPATALAAPIVPPQALSNSWSDLSSDTEMMRYAIPGNLVGLPAISFPVGYTVQGMPVGMQAMGRHWEEHLLLRVAYNAELRLTRRLPATYFGAKML
jgi:Asp-tRNA(Asn)/Glu-tRNA(Gln) amidotransferase A subunit family amidase